MVLQDQNQCVGQAELSSGVLGEEFPGSFRYWENSVPCSYKIEVPISLLVVVFGLL